MIVQSQSMVSIIMIL